LEQEAATFAAEREAWAKQRAAWEQEKADWAREKQQLTSSAQTAKDANIALTTKVAELEAQLKDGHEAEEELADMAARLEKEMGG